MHFTDIFIRRPVFATVINLIILLVGVRAFFDLPVRQYPNIQPSVISISTNYSGASANLMEGFVTTPIEKALGGIDGIDFITSSSTQNSSQISIYFKLGYDVNTAMSDISNAVSSARSALPAGVDNPIITKQDPSANPTIFIAFESTDGKMNGEAITDYLTRVVEPQVESLPGVSLARIFGTGEYAMRIWLDPRRMAAQNITATDIKNAITSNNVQSAPGQIEAPLQEINLSAKTDISTPEEFNDLVIKNTNGYLTRIKDIGHAELGPADNRVSVNINGNKNVVVMGIVPQPTANPLDIAKEVDVLLPNIKKQMPAGLKATLAWDSSKFIANSLKEVRKTIFEAVGFVALIIFLFLGSARAVIIPLITIPLSIIGVCGFMLILGYSINTLTLLAWVLAIGLVVDDAIVVTENIHRHIESGEKPFHAAIYGTREIGFAVIAMTFTLAAVYAPIGFLTDLTGRLFREFAFTLASAVIVSGFIALTLSPMMSSKLLSHEINKQGLAGRIDILFAELMAKYKKALLKILNHRKAVLIGAGIVYLTCYIAYATLHHELAPNEDEGFLMGMVIAPTSANLAYTEKYTNELIDIYKKLPETESYGVINGMSGVNSAFTFLVLKPWSERERAADQILQTLFPAFMQIPGVLAFPFNVPALPSSGGDKPVEFVLKTTGSYDELNNAVKKLMDIAKRNPGLVNIDADLKLDKPQIQINIDRNKANALGISMSDIGDSLNMFMGQPTTTHFEMSGRGYDVIPQLYAEFRSNPQELGDLNVRTTSGQLVPLNNLAQVSNKTSPQSLNHFGQIRASTITASLAPGYTLGEAINFLEKTVKKELSGNIQYDFSGQSRQFIQASGSMATTFGFAIIFIFLILAAQFESFRDPLIVMISVPLSLTGALLTMHLIGATLNIYTQIGLVTLIGLISKHGILMVEFANQLRLKGASIHEAIIESATLRLRPILMTTGAMLLGALPLVIADGAGAVSRSQLGWTIFGGMAFGTLLTLFVVPVVYTFLTAQKIKPHESLIEQIKHTLSEHN